jgi:hypothetical protein
VPGGPAIFWFHRVRQADDVLLRLYCLTLGSLLLSLLLSVLIRNVPTDHAAADCANYSVVPRVMPSNPAYHRALEATCSVCRACCREDQRRCNQGDSYRASFHSKVL